MHGDVITLDVTVLWVVAWIWGVHCIFSEGYTMHRFGLFLERILGTTLCKPLFICPPCMSSVHGLLFAFLISMPYHIIPYFMIVLCGINFIIKKFVYPDYVE